MRYYILFGIGLLAGAFALGRYTTPIKVETKTVTVEVEKVVTKVDTTVVEKINPDGSKVIETHTTTDTKKEADKNTDNSKVVVNNKPSLNISVLAGVDSITSSPRIVYGAHVQKNILGPLSIGLWGLTSGTFGASIGLTF